MSEMPLEGRCTPSDYRRITPWEHDAILEAMQRRLDRKPEAMTLRRRTIEHVFGTLAKALSLTDRTYTLLASLRGFEMYADRLDPGNHCNL